MKKQFDLKYYLEHPETRVVTRDGRIARILCTDLRSNNYPIVAACLSFNRDEDEVNTYTSEGKSVSGSSLEYSRDLLFDIPDPIIKREPLTYEDLLERVKDGKTLFVGYTTEDMTAQIVTFSANKVTVVIRGNIYELSYNWLLTYYFADGNPCWKEAKNAENNV